MLFKVLFRLILGTLWGDEGKGKIALYLARIGQHKVVARWGGGNNAGHTVVINGKRIATHLIPSAAFGPAVRTVILGAGMVIDPAVLLAEIVALRAQGRLQNVQVLLDLRAHLITPWHKFMDIVQEGGTAAIGSTRRGVGPCYADKMLRGHALRVGDLLKPAKFATKVQSACAHYRRLLAGYDGSQTFLNRASIDDWVAQCQTLANGQHLAIEDTVVFLQNVESPVLAEGAQGPALDIDLGTYPYVTSSHPGTAGAQASLGCAPQQISEVFGVTKAYATRVGDGPFPTEIIGDPMETRLRKDGDEFGTTTSRPRRVGWLDLVQLRVMARYNGVTDLVVTKLDILSGKGDLSVCNAYELDGATIQTIPADADDYARCKPIYTRLFGWQEDISACRHRDELPENAQAYLAFIEMQVGVRISLVGVGRDDELIIDCLAKPATAGALLQDE